MREPKFIPVPDKPNWQRAEVADKREKTEAMAKEFNETRPANTYFVCGHREDDSPHMLYRIKTPNPLEIVRDFKVGSHCDYIPDIESKVQQELGMVHARNPIVPYFADAAGFKCMFENSLNDDFANFLDSTVTEGLEIYAQSEDGEFGSVVVRSGFLHLWWD